MYRITQPANLAEEIEDLAWRINRFRTGVLSAAELKAFRVPFGIYEQRQKGSYMVRIRCAAGIISPQQLSAVAKLAAQYGSGTLHVTTRQELQMHDIPLDNITPVLKDLLLHGLSSRGGGGNTVRNITASWDAGIATSEPFDVTPYVTALTSRMIALPNSWLLPRKYKIAISNSNEDTAFATLNDLGFIARTVNGINGFSVYVAGGLGRSPQAGHLLHEFIPGKDLFIVAEAIKRLFSRYGNRRNRHAARLRFLWNHFGRERFITLYEQERDILNREKCAPFEIAPFTNKHLPASSRTTPSPDVTPSYVLWRNRFVTLQSQSGLHCVKIPLSHGNLSSAAAGLLAKAVEETGDATIRFSQNQNIILRNIPEQALSALFETVVHITPLRDSPNLVGDAVACTGAQTCQLGICFSRNALTATIDELSASPEHADAAGSLRIHFSGCSNSCGQHWLADLGFAGKAAQHDGKRYPAYTVVAGAHLDAQGGSQLARKVGDIPARMVPQFTAAFIKEYALRKKEYASYLEYLDKEGFAYLSHQCATFQVLPSPHTNMQFYIDWGAEEPFSLEGRGTGECASGLFDLVDIDIRQMNTLREQIGNCAAVSPDAETLYRLAHIASRALLVTQGVTLENDSDVFERFKESFISTNLVPASFLPVINGLCSTPSAAHRYRNDIIALSHHIQSLYDSMDDTLQFHPEQVAAPPEPQQTPPPVIALTCDLRGITCPMNFVKTKLALAKIAPGEVLEILLDDGPPIDNVPRSVEGEGHTVLQQKREPTCWSVNIRKGR